MRRVTALAHQAAGLKNRASSLLMASSPVSADIVVIGSGICGSLVAERLARTNASVVILEAGPRVERAQLVLNYRNSPRKGDWMAPYPQSRWAPHPVYKPDPGNDYLVQAGPYPYP